MIQITTYFTFNILLPLPLSFTAPLFYLKNVVAQTENNSVRALKKGSFCLTIAPEGFATQCMYVIQLLNNDGLTSCKTAKSMEK